jgi:hypothetical protein
MKMKHNIFGPYGPRFVFEVKHCLRTGTRIQRNEHTDLTSGWGRLASGLWKKEKSDWSCRGGRDRRENRDSRINVWKETQHYTLSDRVRATIRQNDPQLAAMMRLSGKSHSLRRIPLLRSLVVGLEGD